MRRDFPHRVSGEAWSLAGFTVLVLIATLVLAGLDASRMDAARVGFYVIGGLAVLAYAGAACMRARPA